QIPGRGVDGREPHPASAFDRADLDDEVAGPAEEEPAGLEDDGQLPEGPSQAAPARERRSPVTAEVLHSPAEVHGRDAGEYARALEQDLCQPLHRLRGCELAAVDVQLRHLEAA